MQPDFFLVVPQQDGHFSNLFMAERALVRSRADDGLCEPSEPVDVERELFALCLNHFINAQYVATSQVDVQNSISARLLYWRGEVLV
jgi:hypothetical protein